MHQKRDALSLSGLPIEFIAVGGWSGKCLKIVEKYNIGVNKWSEAPSLNNARKYAASLLL